MSWIACTGVSLYAVIATCWDVRERRIPNWLSGTALLLALPVAASDSGIGLVAAGSGFVLGGVAFFVPFVLGAMGAGDLKFAAVAGAWLGPYVGLHALLLGTALGLFVGIGSAAGAGRLGEAIRGAARLVYLFASSLSVAALPPADREAARVAPIPYAAPLAAGVIGAVLLANRGWLLF
jgi:prepilin peptidase CpaA